MMGGGGTRHTWDLNCMNCTFVISGLRGLGAWDTYSLNCHTLGYNSGFTYNREQMTSNIYNHFSTDGNGALREVYINKCKGYKAVTNKVGGPMP